MQNLLLRIHIGKSTKKLFNLISFKRNLKIQFQNSNWKKEANYSFEHHKILKDVLVYQNKRITPRLLIILAYGQLVYFFQATYSTYNLKKLSDDVIVTAPLGNLQKNLLIKTNSYADVAHRIALIPFITGCICFVGCFAIWRNQVRRAVVKSGGLLLELEVLSIFGRTLKKSILLNELSANTTRQASNTFIMVYRKNKTLPYAFDTDGKFMNPRIFDEYVSVQRL